MLKDMKLKEINFDDIDKEIKENKNLYMGLDIMGDFYMKC